MSEALKSSPDKLIMGCHNFQEMPLRKPFATTSTKKFSFLICRKGKGKATRECERVAFSTHTFYAVISLGDRYEFEMNMPFQMCKKAKIL